MIIQETDRIFAVGNDQVTGVDHRGRKRQGRKVGPKPIRVVAKRQQGRSQLGFGRYVQTMAGQPLPRTEDRYRA